MNKDILDFHIRSVTFQRNIFLSLTIILALSVVLGSVFLFRKNERIIITPPIVEKEFWVEGSNISPTYLEQIGVFIGQLLLNKSVQSAAGQRMIILRHVAPDFFQVMRKRLIEEEEVLKQQNIAYTFYTDNVHVDLSQMEVKLTGDRVAYAGGKLLSSQRESYILRFIFNGSKLLLKGMWMENSHEKK